MKIRNIGIIAHIDAGKTTTTEKMLYYCGALPQPGSNYYLDVDEGTTVMDYLPQERTRGITIRAASITFNWSGFHMNLIDTPGHIDFSGEVERSLRVIDGSILVIDSNNGVQAQTQTVWRQAEKFHVPRLIFLNKMDAISASTELAISQIQSIFNATPLLLQIPVYSKGLLQGVVDLVKMKYIKYKDLLGRDYESVGIEEIDAQTKDIAEKARVELLEAIASLDDRFAEQYLDTTYTYEDIMLAIRKLTVIMKAFPVMCGSSLKNRGIQPLLDGIINFLPSPAESPPAEGLSFGKPVSRSHTDRDLCALAFKVIQNSIRGPLVYMRIYSGTLKHGVFLKNSSRKNTVEKVSRLLRVRGNEYVELDEAQAGDVVAAGGLKEVYSGDTLIHKNDNSNIALPGVKMPPPMFFCSISSEDENKDKELEEILKNITREDPSYTASFDGETNQIMITGQGELHLEILRDRILSDYKFKVKLGELRIAYRESAKKDSEIVYELNKAGHFLSLKLKLEKEEHKLEFSDVQEAIHGHNFDKIHATAGWHLSKHPELYDQKIAEIKESGGSKAEEEEYLPLSRIKHELHNKIMESIKFSLDRGNKMGYPLINLKITVVDGIFSKTRTNIVAINEAVTFSIRELLEKSEGMIYEPIMALELEVPDENVSLLINDITVYRRGYIKDVNRTQNYSVIYANAPLKEILGYPTILRTVTKGMGNMNMTFHSYNYVGEEIEEKLINFKY